MANAGWSRTGTAMTWPSSTSRMTGSRSSAGSRSAPNRAGWCSRPTARRPTWRSASANEVVRVDLDGRRVTGRLAGRARAARAGALARRRDCSWSATPGRRTCRSSTLQAWKVERTVPIDGVNLRQVTISSDGKIGVRRQHEEPRVRHDEEQHRPRLGAGPAVDPAIDGRTEPISHALARPAGARPRPTPTAWP